MQIAPTNVWCTCVCDLWPLTSLCIRWSTQWGVGHWGMWFVSLCGWVHPFPCSAWWPLTSDLWPMHVTVVCLNQLLLNVECLLAAPHYYICSSSIHGWNQLPYLYICWKIYIGTNAHTHTHTCTHMCTYIHTYRQTHIHTQHCCYWKVKQCDSTQWQIRK